MGTTIALGNVVGITEDIFLKTVIPLQGHLDTGPILTLNVKMHDLINRGLVGVQIFHEGLESTLILIDVLFTAPLIKQHNTHT